MKLIIHIGMPKTGTTTLQNHVFMKLHNNNLINFLGRSTNSKNIFYPTRRIIKGIIEDSESEFKSNFTYYKNQLRSLIHNDKINVISEELLAETLYTKKYSRNIYTNIIRLANLLKETDVEVSIIYTIRNQNKAIYSLFVEWYVKHFWDSQYNFSFTNYLSTQVSLKKNNLQMFLYHKNYIFIKKYFKNTHILIYEQLLDKKDEYVSELANILSVDKKYIIEGFEFQDNVKNVKGNNYLLQQRNLHDLLSNVVKSNKWLMKLKKTIFNKSKFTQLVYIKFINIMNLFYKTESNINIEKPTKEDLKIIEDYFGSDNYLLSKLLKNDLEIYDYPIKKD